MWVEHTVRSEHNASDAESNSSADSAQSYENSTTMSGNQSQTQSAEQPTAGVTHKEETHMEDFATALESYTLETEPAPSEDNVFKGTVIKITATHVVVDIGFKSEGLVPIAEVTDAHGNVKFEPGQEIEVMVQRGENEEGSVLLSHERASRVRVWENIEKAYHSKEAVKGTVVERVKGGVSVDIGVKAFMPGSQVDVHPVRNLETLKGQEIEVRVIKLNKKRGNIVVSRKAILDEEVASKRGKTLENL
ncbi:MAG TPA: S1 RNA-binding domain-containing protein, partial [Candidatus Angelobacter sp.]|nr:S1 RNA-binding domain-containing protein [Candidatus Angelobacter sp.]